MGDLLCLARNPSTRRWEIYFAWHVILPFENFLKNNTDDAANEACSWQKALEGEGMQAYDINPYGLPKGPTDYFFDIFVPALRDLLSIACKADIDDKECEQIIQDVLSNFEICRKLKTM